METINFLFKDTRIVYFICFMLAIYISFIQSRLNSNQLKLFKNDYIRIIYVFIIIFIFNKNNIIGLLLTIAYLTMSSSLISEDFFVKENFYTPEEISKLLKQPHTMCSGGRHKNLCVGINKEYENIEKSTTNILDTCTKLKNKNKIKQKPTNTLDTHQEYDNFNLKQSNYKHNEFSKILT